MTVRERTYAAALGTASGLVAGMGRGRGSLSRAVWDRRAAVDRLVDWAVRERRRERPLLWLHGASAGELVGAAPIVRRIRTRARIQLLVTFSSSSGSAAAAALEPDWLGFPPLDAPKPCRRAIRAAAPSALVFARLDVWPGLSAAAERAGVGLGLVNGTVRSDSSRLKAGARWLLKPAYARLQRVGAVSPADALRLRALGVRPETLTVMGDAAFDAALERVDGAGPVQLEARRRLRRWCDSRADPRRPVLLAGSTWPPDEEMLLMAAAALAERGLGLTLVLVPHEPTRAAVARLRARCRSHLGVEPDVWSGLSAAPKAGRGPLIVDAVGLLSTLYPVADVAYVGGGFGPGGLHSVIEPAAAGLPVLFARGRSRAEARGLRVAGAARRLDRTSAAAAVAQLIEDERLREEMGARGRRYIERGAGGAAAGAEILHALLGTSAISSSSVTPH